MIVKKKEHATKGKDTASEMMLFYCAFLELDRGIIFIELKLNSFDRFHIAPRYDSDRQTFVMFRQSMVLNLFRALHHVVNSCLSIIPNKHMK